MNKRSSVDACLPNAVVSVHANRRLSAPTHIDSNAMNRIFCWSQLARLRLVEQIPEIIGVRRDVDIDSIRARFARVVNLDRTVCKSRLSLRGEH